MLLTLLVALVLSLAILFLAYLLWFRQTGEQWEIEVGRVRHHAAETSRRMHELTRQAFVAMTEEADARRRRGQ